MASLELGSLSFLSMINFLFGRMAGVQMLAVEDAGVGAVSIGWVIEGESTNGNWLDVAGWLADFLVNPSV